MTISYPNQWTRIYGGTRPVIFMIVTGFAAFFVGILLLLVTNSIMVAILSALGTAAVLAAGSLFWWVRGQHLAVNIGTGQIRVGKTTYALDTVTDIQIQPHRGNIKLLFANGHLVIPAAWLTVDRTRLIIRAFQQIDEHNMPAGVHLTAMTYLQNLRTLQVGENRV